MFICAAVALIVFLTYANMKGLVGATILAVVAFFMTKWLLGGEEQFQSEWACWPGRSEENGDKRLPWGLPGGFRKDAAPFFYPKSMLRAEQEAQIAEGDNTLTNLYRQVHNLDAIQRTEIFKFGDALAGGGYGIPAEPYVGEAYDRAMMGINQNIRTDIAASRIPYSEMYDVPTRPLMGNFYDCEMGNCQWSADADGRILGIPSQVGTQPAYY